MMEFFKFKNKKESKQVEPSDPVLDKLYADRDRAWSRVLEANEKYERTMAVYNDPNRLQREREAFFAEIEKEKELLLEKERKSAEELAKVKEEYDAVMRAHQSARDRK